MATAVVAPNSFAQAQTDLGYTYVFAAQAIAEEIAERVSVLGLMPMVGDLVGTGSDTLRLTHFGGVGYAEAMTAMATETEAIVASGFTTDVTSATIGRYGLGKSETYQASLLNRSEGVSLDRLASLIPDSVQKTLRQLMLTSGSGITGVVGTAGTPWTFDDEVSLVTGFNESEGFEGAAQAWRHPECFSDLAASLRNEPAYQDPSVMSSIQGLKPNGGSFNFLGIENHASHDTATSGADHIGCAFAPGAIGWVRASTLPLQGRVANPARAMYMPEVGLVIEYDSDGPTASSEFWANAWFGTVLMPAVLFPQYRIRSVND